MERRKHQRIPLMLSAIIGRRDCCSATIIDACNDGLKIEIINDGYIMPEVGDHVQIEMTVMNFWRGTLMNGDPELITLTVPRPETAVLDGKIQHISTGINNELYLGIKLEEDKHSSINVLRRHLDRNGILS